MGSRLEENSKATRKRIDSHTFTDEGGDEYGASSFGGFGEYMRRKKIKLQNLDAERRARNASSSASGDGNPPIFRGVVAHVNGYTQPSLGDLHKLIVDYGGGFQQYLDGKTACTHIIAASVTPKKREEFRRYRIVKPAWVVDSVKAGKLLPWDRYRVIEDVTGQRTIGFTDGKIVSQQGAADNRSYKDQMDSSWYVDQVRAKAEMIDGRTPGSSVRPSQDVYRVSVLPDDARILDDGERVQAEHDITPTEFATDEEDEAQFPAETDPVSDREPSPLADKLDRPEEVDEFAKKKASYLTAEDLRPDDAGDRQGGGIKLPFPNPKTAEEHNANLLADPKRWKSTVVNPDFLKQYYAESRLHHLSTWKAELKSHLQALAQEQSSSQKARQKRPKGARRYVLHVDFDSFFVAVSMLKHPELQDTPTVVAHGGGSGSEIASCNYPARKFGVKNGMWMSRARELCPNIKVLPYDFKAYEDASRKFYKVMMDVGGIVQSVSIDEALIDVSMICLQTDGADGADLSEDAREREQQKANEVAQEIRDKVKDLTGCAVSVGIGANILQAKLALRKAKPAGQYQLLPGTVLDFIGDLTVQELPGVAYNIGNKLEEIGIKYIRNIRESTKERLITTMGPKTGEKLWEYAQGIDRVEVGEQTVRKSVSAEVNWGIRFATQEQAEEFIASLCEELEKRLLSELVKGKQFTMKLMRRAKDAPLDPPKHMGHGQCDTFNKSVVLRVATNDKVVLTKEALSILRSFGFPPGELRGIGVQVTKIEPMRGPKSMPESSQRLLNFGQSAQSPTTKSPRSALKDVSTPSKASAVTFADEDADDARGNLAAPTPTRVPVIRGEDNIETPRKSRTEDMLGLITPNRADHLDDILLNTTGTQFILPTQADPEVIAALPEDIRSRFARASAIAREKQDQLKSESRLKSESPGPAGYDDITQSQLDPETLAALPDDIREEVLAQYKHRGSPRPIRQSVLPQSPHKVRSIKVPIKKPTSTRGRGGLSSRGRGRKHVSVPSDMPTLTQANFVFSKADKAKVDSGNTTEEDEIPAEVLDELPADIRAEILEQQQRDRLLKKGGIDVVRKRRPATLPEEPAQGTLIFVRRPPKPTFTSRKLSTLPELREAVTAWFQGTRQLEIEMEDVESLSKYLRQVIIDEKDMHKAVSVVKWLLWLIDEGGPEAEERWEEAAGKLTRDVQASITERGLGKIEF